MGRAGGDEGLEDGVGLGECDGSLGCKRGEEGKEEREALSVNC